MPKHTITATTGAEPKFVISHFDSVTATMPREIVETWLQLIRRFSTPTIRASKSGPLWSAARFNGQRAKDNVIELCALVLDFDHGLSFDEAAAIVSQLGVTAAIHSTYSHTPQAHRFRVIILLATPITPRDYSKLLKRARKFFNDQTDAACSDPGRMFYWPAVPNKEARKDFRFQNFIGAGPLDWRSILEAIPDDPQPTAESEQSPSLILAQPSDAYIRKAIDGEIARLESATPGNRNNTLNKSVFNLARLGIDRGTVEAALIPIAKRLGLTDAEIKATFKSAFVAGSKRPRIINSRGNTMQNSKSRTTNSSKAAGTTQQAKQSSSGNGAAQSSGNTAGSGAQKAQGKQTSGQTKKASAPRYNADPIDLVLKRATLFHDAEGRVYATIKRNGHVETRSIKSRDFTLWWKGAFFEAAGKPLSSDTFTAAVSVIEAMAQFRGPERRVHLRVAEHGENIYTDLCDASWRVVEITPNDWRIIESTKSPVTFTRRGGMLGLPEPVQGGELNELRPLANCGQQGDDDTWTLLASWLVMGFNPGGPYPILSVGGEQGSGKSTTSRMLQRLIDPNAGDLRGVPKEERDLMIAANNCWLLAYDNLSGVLQEMSDRLCRLATGAGFGTRTLHTNDEETIFAARRPILVNGISDIHYPDFLDRSVSVYLRQIPDDERRDEKAIWAEFDRVRPRILGALFSGVSHALKNQASVKLDRKPRMADFAVWASAAEKGLGLAENAFMTAYEGNRAAAHEVALDTSPAIEIREFVETKMTNPEWQGRASDLLDNLNLMLSDKKVDHLTKPNWPKGPNKLTEVLRRMAPNFRAVGIEINCNRSRKGSKITIKRTK